MSSAARDPRFHALHSKPRRAAETAISPAHICCGQRLRRHSVEPELSGLSFTYCGRCESLRWFRADLPISDPGGFGEAARGSA